MKMMVVAALLVLSVAGGTSAYAQTPMQKDPGVGWIMVA